MPHDTNAADGSGGTRKITPSPRRGEPKLFTGSGRHVRHATSAGPIGPVETPIGDVTAAGGPRVTAPDPPDAADCPRPKPLGRRSRGSAG